jgi:hypothetical protein
MPEDKPPAKKAMIFTSYGWRDAEDVARKLAQDLAAAGYEVWIDRERIRPDQRFPDVIHHAISDADVILVLISPHSVRLPGDDQNADNGASVCLNELLQAHEERKPFVPVVVVPAEPPWLLNIVDRIDFSNRPTEAAYRAGLTEILRRIALARETGRTIYIAAIERLHPLDFRNEIARGAGEFIGRRWLFARIDDWIAGPRRCLVIEGDAGTGKSAVVAELIRRDPGEKILAYHFCRADQASTVQPAEFVRSIAAIAGGRIDGYRAQLDRDDLRVRLVGDACVADPLRTFFSCVVNPLSELPALTSRYIVVDAIDEAFSVRAGAAAIPSLIAQALRDFPPWLKIIVTMRRSDRLHAQFADAEFIRLEADDPAQRADVAAYLEKRFGAADPNDAGAAQAIEERSAGNFLYARQVANAVAEGDLRVDEVNRLPSGLGALFGQTFQSRFPDAASYAKPERMLGVLLAAKEPLTATQLAAIAGLDRRADVLPFLETLTGYIVASDRQSGESTLTVFHKSLADWLESPPVGAGAFRVDVAAGRQRLRQWCGQWRLTADRYALLHVVAHLLDAAAADEALAAVREGLFAKRQAALGDSRADLEDAMALAAALAGLEDENAIFELATTGGAWQKNGVAAALQSPAFSSAAIANRLVGRLLAAPMPDPLLPSAEALATRRMAIRIAEARRLDNRLLEAAEDKSPAVRVALATMIYRYWLRQREDGWRLLEKLAAAMMGPLSFPRTNILECFGHASLAILNNHQDEPEAMTRLLGIWRGYVEKLMRSATVRLLGNRWALGVMLGPLIELMKRQPAYQPFNAQEMAVTFARGEDFRRNWKAALDCLEHPQRGLGGLVALLSRADLPFDVYLMLVCERALVVAGAADPEGTLSVLETLFRDGVPWFRQSVLYVLFHLLGRAKSVPDDWLDRYGAMTRAFFADGGATLATEVAHYSFAPHLAWPEVVHERRRPGSGPWLLPDLLEDSLKSGDRARVDRVFKAIDLVGFAYGRRTLALALIARATAIGGAAIEDQVVEALANVRFEDEALVDDLLETPDFARFKSAVRAASPSIRGEDIPTWIDGFVVQSMLTSDAFRLQVCDAFRRALTARSTKEFLMQIMIWVVNLLAGRRVAGEAA